MDISPAKYEAISRGLTSGSHLFVACDVSQWEQQLDVFKKAFEWNGGYRIDFVAMNAGIDERAYGPRHPFTPSGEPVKPNLGVIGVDLNAVIYGTHLITHYARKSRELLGSSDLTTFHPRAVVTASMAAQYPFYNIPQYAAAKHGVIGWVRSVAPALWQRDRVAINCIMPGTVDTGIIPESILTQWPADCLTPMSTILRAFDEFLLEEGAGVVGSEATVRYGHAVEVSVDHLYYRDPVPFADKSQEWIVEQSKEEGIIGRVTAQYFRGVSIS